MVENMEKPVDTTPFWNDSEVPSDTSEEFTRLIKCSRPPQCCCIDTKISIQVNGLSQPVRDSCIGHQILTVRPGIKRRIQTPILHSETKV